MTNTLQAISAQNTTFTALTLSQATNFRLFQTKEFADDNFEFNKDCRKFSCRVENTVEKGEITCYEQFLLFPTVFSKDLILFVCKKLNAFGFLRCYLSPAVLSVWIFSFFYNV